MLVAALLGSPVFTTLGGAALFLFWHEGLPMASIPLDHLPAGRESVAAMIRCSPPGRLFPAEGGAPGRLIRCSTRCSGGLRGGAAIVTVVACAFFTSFSGASGSRSLRVAAC